MRHPCLLLTSFIFSFMVALSCHQGNAVAQGSLLEGQVVSAYTSGEVSTKSTIRVRFVHDIVDSASLGVPLKKSPFSFKPKIKGVAVWANPRTLEFKPNRRLPGGQEYIATVNLSEFMEVVGASKTFEFKFTTIRQSFEITIEGLGAESQTDLRMLQLAGKVLTADSEPGTNIVRILKAEQVGRDLNIRWSHSDRGRHHSFVIAGIRRGDQPSEIVLQWDGNSIGVNRKGKRTIPVPPQGPFELMEARAIHGETQYIQLRFTDPLQRGQNLTGMIRVDGRDDLRFGIDRNIVRVFSTSRWTTEVKVQVERGIRNILGQRLAKRKTVKVSFEEVKPQVRFVGKGVILPTTLGLTVPIEAVNLRAVVVEAMRIFEDNIPQFLQINDLEGGDELRRVGRIVWKKTVKLDHTPEMKNQWTRYGLDLTQLIANHPEGLFRIQLSFRRPHIAYTCADGGLETEPQGISTDNWDEAEESSSWDYYEQNENYSWYECYDQRKNPCHPGYYMEFHDHKIVVSRNVLISDIGLIAKRGSDESVLVVATDVKTGKPLSGITLRLLDYQQRAICTGRTDPQGMAVLSVERKPFLVVAENGGQRGYLKLDDGSALSVGHFDVSGQTVRKGLKGFIYGERGVWRPGDQIYITFILLDNENKLPENHPVIFELRNPKGQLVRMMKKTQSVNRFYCFETKTAPDAPTGRWTARIRVGGVTFEKTLRIETVMPNRLKIGLDFGPDTESLSGGTIRGELSAAWLHGAVAKNLKADVMAAFTARKTHFPKYHEYVFDDPVRTYEPESQTVFEGDLDENGRATITADMQVENLSPGMLTANFTTRVFEPSGAFSTDRLSIPFHPYKQYIGVRTPKGDKARGMLLTDTDHTVRIVAVDPDGNPVRDAEVEIELYKIKWRWWWEKGDENLADYVGSSSYRAIKKGRVKLANGSGEWQFKVKYPSWGRYLIRVRDVNGKHYTGKIVYIDWPGWAGRAQKDIPGGATVLTFSSDKEKYEVGEKVVLTIPTGRKGRGLVSIETGSKVLQTSWIEAKEEGTRFEFLATRTMVPNVYAQVSLIQPHMQAGNDLPIRMYGVIPVKVEDPATRLHPQITAPDSFVPEETAEITIREAHGNPMTYTIAIVDEGLLDLTRFPTPDPWEHFYKREALGVKTWDIYDMVAGAYGGVLERLLAIGGGEASEEMGEKKAERFPPMVRFLGPFILERDGKNTHHIDIPQYVGSVRVMVVAGHGGAFGSEERAVPVKKPLMVLGTLPRVLSPDEEVEFPVSVFALDEKVKDVSVKVITKGAISLVDSSQKSIAFSDPGDEMVTFKLKAGSEIDFASVSVQASSRDERAGQTIGLDVRPPVGPVVDVADSVISKGKTWRQTIAFPGMVGTNKISLEVSRIPPINLSKRLGFLVHYPHGCVEQVTSSVFPQLYLDRLVGLSPHKVDEIERNIKAGIERLRTFQTTDGGFGYWPGANQAQEWVTSYAGHFLLEARKAGYMLPPRLLDHWKDYQRRKALSWVAGPSRSELIQAYRLYTLALAASAELGAMNRLREHDDLPTAARWRLATAYQLAGQPEAAEDLVRGRRISLTDYRELSNTYGSGLRDKAMVLEALCLMRQTKRAVALVEEISQELSGNRWMSTQTTAYALIAIAHYAGIAGRGEEMKFSFSWNSGGEETVSSTSPLVQRSLAAGDESTGTIEVKNLSKITLYPRVILEGTPAPGSETAAKNGMALDLRYLTPKGAPIDPSVLEQGVDLVVELEVTNTGRRGDYEEVALSHLVPSGWEIHSMRMDPSAKDTAGEFDYQDIRDDRIYTYFDLKQGQSKTFRAQLNASYLGRFYLPMVKVEAMYDGTINARIPGRWVTVVKPGQGNR